MGRERPDLARQTIALSINLLSVFCSIFCRWGCSTVDEVPIWRSWVLPGAVGSLFSIYQSVVNPKRGPCVVQQIFLEQVNALMPSLEQTKVSLNEIGRNSILSHRLKVQAPN